MKTSKTQRNKEYEVVHEIYESLNLRQMEHLVNLISDRIVVPHHNGKEIEELEVIGTHINGTVIGLITDKFDEYARERDTK